MVTQKTISAGRTMSSLPDSAPLLTAHQISVAYSQKTLFQRLDISLHAGQVAALLGPNGVGKTSLLRCLAKLQQPSQGHVSVASVVGFVPQSSELNSPYTVAQVVAMGRSASAGLFGGLRVSDHAAIARALDWCDLHSLKHQVFTLLSGGERQRVLIARALAQESPVLILDEPMAAMDLYHQQGLLQLLKRLAQELHKLVIFSTHLPQHALSAASHCILMSSSGDVDIGEAAAVLTEQQLGRCFGVPCCLTNLPSAGRSKSYLVPLL
jgi:iron complex transport system ATP-binding protein